MTPVPRFLQRARELASAAPTRTDAGFLARSGDGTGEIFLYDAIGSDPWTGGGVTAKDVAAALDKLRGVSSLNVYVNSPGGSVHEGLAIVALLDRFPAKKTVHVDGVAASIASVIAASAERVVMHRSSTLMIHEAWTGAMGNAHDLRALADTLDMYSGIIADTYARKSGKAHNDLRELMKAETWLTAEQAVELGLADEIASDEPQPARVAAGSTTVAYAAASRLVSAGRLAATLRRASVAKGQ